MILGRYIFKELLATSIYTNIVLVILFFVLFLASMADLLLNGGFSGLDLIRLALDLCTPALVITLPASLLAATLMTFVRMSSDLEVISIRALGGTNATFIVPCMLVALIYSIVLLLVSFIVVPAATQDSKRLMDSLVGGYSIAEFYENNTNDDLDDLSIYTGELVGEGLFRPLFLLFGDGEVAITSNKGEVNVESGSLVSQHDEGSIAVVSETGDIEDTTIIHFNDGVLELYFDPEENLGRADNLGGLTMSQLLSSDNPSYRYELYKRLMDSISVFLLGLIGFSLGVFISRAGRFTGYSISLIVIAVYNLATFLGRTWADAGTFPILAAMLGNVILLIIFLQSYRKVVS